MSPEKLIDLRKVFTLILILVMADLGAVNIWVSPEGNDSNPGTEAQPMATIDMALRKARELRRLNYPSIVNGVTIMIMEGSYQLYEPILIRPEDSGSESSPTIIRGSGHGRTVLSGGIKVNNWTRFEGILENLPDEASGKLWVADLTDWGEQNPGVRQLWVNGVKAQRASNLGDGMLARILDVDHMNETLIVPAIPYKLSAQDHAELVIHQWWATAILRIKDINQNSDSAWISFHQPESRIEFEHPWPAPFLDTGDTLNGNSAFYLVNSIALLNRPGEWYFDAAESRLYYWPGEGEEMEEAQAIIPRLEQLIRIEGSADDPVSHIVFEGLDLQHTAWGRPGHLGHVPIQAGMSLVDAYKLKIPGTEDKASLENQAWIDRQSAAFEASYASDITITGCSFRHMAATGLDFLTGVKNSRVVGSLFSDIGGTGVQIGFFGNNSTEIHLPYNPSDIREVCHHIRIDNNLITDCTNEDWGCVGISVGFAHNISIEHNEVSHVNYSGICVGWGWTSTVTCMKNNRIHANHIHHFAKQMYDVGGIYTLSAQPETVISNNAIHHLEKAPYAHIPSHYQYIYLDEGSSYIRIENNWTEKDRFFSNTPGPGNIWKNNGPDVSDDIRKSAGLQPDFQELIKKQ